MALAALIIATAIFLEHYVPIPGRDDDSFRETLRSISYRTPDAPVYANGVQVSDEKDIKRIERLVDQARASVAVLDELGDDATEEDAAKAWKKVFRHSFFDEVAEAARSAAALETKSATAVAGAPFVAKPAATAPSDAERLERMRASLAERQNKSKGAPWAR